MKKLIALLMALIFLTAGCTSRTEYGECIGITDKERKELEYVVSGWNVFLAIFFVETIWVPAWIIFNEIKCPIGKTNGK